MLSVGFCQCDLRVFALSIRIALPKSRKKDKFCQRGGVHLAKEKTKPLPDTTKDDCGVSRMEKNHTGSLGQSRLRIEVIRNLHRLCLRCRSSWHRCHDPPLFEKTFSGRPSPKDVREFVLECVACQRKKVAFSWKARIHNAHKDHRRCVGNGSLVTSSVPRDQDDQRQRSLHL